MFDLLLDFSEPPSSSGYDVVVPSYESFQNLAFQKKLKIFPYKKTTILILKNNFIESIINIFKIKNNFKKLKLLLALLIHSEFKIERISLDYLNHRSQLNSSVLEVSEQLAEINSQLIEINTKIMASNQSIADFNAEQIAVNKDLIDGNLQVSNATPDSNAETIKNNHSIESESYEEKSYHDDFEEKDKIKWSHHLIWATGILSTDKDPDPGKVVWDEYVGLWITCFL